MLTTIFEPPMVHAISSIPTTPQQDTLRWLPAINTFALLRHLIPTLQASNNTIYPSKVVEVSLHMIMTFYLRYGNQN
jgi:hypothetical protein